MSKNRIDLSTDAFRNSLGPELDAFPLFYGNVQYVRDIWVRITLGLLAQDNRGT